MKNRALVVLLLVPVVLFAQVGNDHFVRQQFLSAPAASFGNGLVGFYNPANLQFLNQFETRFAWTTEEAGLGSFHDWALLAGSRGLGFGMVRQNIGNGTVTNYRVSSGFGTNGFAMGLGYGWSGSDGAAVAGEKHITAGAVFRPNPYLSIGLNGAYSIESDATISAAELALRPLGSPALTLFGDLLATDKTCLSDAAWSAGAALRVVEGIHLVGRYFDSELITVGLSINMGRGGISLSSHMDSDQNVINNTYMVRSGQMEPSLFNKLKPAKSTFLPINMKGRVDYLSYEIFDTGVIKFSSLLKNIRAAANDPAVGAIVLNLSSMAILPEHAWEVREALKEAKAKNKMIVAFIDRAMMTEYHLASVADKIVIDPEGTLFLAGYTMSRTYLKGTLEKLGLGFDEWRFFKYKSAMETFSRDSYSEADREQRQDFVDSQYELVRGEVGESRNISAETFDDIIDNGVLILPEEAIKAGLVDTTGRWSDLDKIMETLMAKKVHKTKPALLHDNAIVRDRWGTKPQIAVVYALGECAMDTGIRGRWLEQVLLKLEKNKNVKAIVFRADSPGGDAMASDLVAEALKKCKEKKPVIVSQGQVAGSGGYWISMYGDKILAGPNTITGSIGVIGGWIWDKGFSDKLGMTYDKVQRGAHADLLSGVTLPLIGLQVPARNLTSDERSKMEASIRHMYDRFVKKVAAGRNLDEARVREIAEGHFYSGLDGKEIGLVDEIGGLQKAIDLAREKAGIAKEAEIDIIEIPKNKGLFNLGIPFVSTGYKLNQDPVLHYIRRLSERPGGPLFMLPPDAYPIFNEN